MSRLTNEERAKQARDVLIQTIAKIDDLEPTLGGKWKRNMVQYYVRRLAELLLYQSGFSNPSEVAVKSIEVGIKASLFENGGID